MVKNKTKCSVRGPVTDARETRRGARRRVPILCFVINQWREDGEGVGPTDDGRMGRESRVAGSTPCSVINGSGSDGFQPTRAVPGLQPPFGQPGRTFSQLPSPFCT